MRSRPLVCSDDSHSLMIDNPLGLGNWQMTQKSAFSLLNKTGSDVHIAASTLA
jgi:hypothetical protein